jgi:hypothetical protein
MDWSLIDNPDEESERDCFYGGWSFDSELLKETVAYRFSIDDLRNDFPHLIFSPWDNTLSAWHRFWSRVSIRTCDMIWSSIAYQESFKDVTLPLWYVIWPAVSRPYSSWLCIVTDQGSQFHSGIELTFLCPFRIIKTHHTKIIFGDYRLS